MTHRVTILIHFTVLLFAVACATRETTKSSLHSGADRRSLADTLEISLRKEILDPWYPESLDTVHGGYISTYTYDWKPHGEQQKMIVTQARHCWVNSKAALLYPDVPYYREGAKHGFAFLRDRMWDKTYGGFYTLVSRDGTALDSAKTVYGNAFAIFALSAYYALSGDTAALNLAQKTFLWLERYSHDPVHKGYFQHLTRNGTVVQRLATTDSHAETGYKDQNSSIHLLEAFTELYPLWPDGLLRSRLEEMLLLIRDTITTPKGYLVLFFTPDWRPVSFRDSSRDVILDHHGLDHVSFGHDIETAYLMLEASHALGRENDPATITVAKRMVDHCLEKGWDPTVGGFYDEGYYFRDDDDITIIRDTKNWWAQAEALNTLLLMADRFPDDPMEYDQKFLKQWEYIDRYLIDHQYGDWFAGGLDKEPDQRTALKGHIWKAAYHQFRAVSNCIAQLRSNIHTQPD